MQRQGHVVVVSPGRGAWEDPSRGGTRPRGPGRAGRRYVNCIGTAPAAAALAVGGGHDARPARPRRSGRRGPGLLDAVRHTGRAVSTLTCTRAHAARAFPGAPHRGSGLSTPMPSPSWPRRSQARPPWRFRSTPCSTRPRACRSLFRSRCGVASRRGQPPPREAALRAAAGRQELRAAQADLTSSVVDLQQALDRGRRRRRGRRASLSVQGPGELRRRGCRHVLRARAARRRLVALPGATLLGVVGPSGSGKSSIVRAGLSAALASGATRSEEWCRSSFDRESIRSTSCRARRNRTGSRLLLVIDQLEEVFTLCRDEAERMLFLDALTRLAPHETVVIAVRADFYGRFATLSTLARQLAENHVVVGPMKAEDLRRAIGTTVSPRRSPGRACPGGCSSPTSSTSRAACLCSPLRWSSSGNTDGRTAV